MAIFANHIVCAPTVLSLPLNDRNMATPSFSREDIIDSSGEVEYLDCELDESGDDSR